MIQSKLDQARIKITMYFISFSHFFFVLFLVKIMPTLKTHTAGQHVTVEQIKDSSELYSVRRDATGRVKVSAEKRRANNQTHQTCAFSGEISQDTVAK